ncbi:MAG: patatin-like phospholipase family protein [Proteobacteria bacterium]|nr:patatin-like phospholipase family protein [Pseudomonadota bacterium]
MLNLKKLIRYLFPILLFLSLFELQGCAFFIAAKSDPRLWSDERPSAKACPIILDRLNSREADILQLTQVEKNHLIGERQGIKREDIAAHNYLISRYYREIESAYYRCAPDGERQPKFKNSAEINQSVWPDGLPQLGLAMSGGGLRSASFNIGVLQGLNDLEILDKVDIMSSVSGGSYANLWFHVNKLTSPRNDGLSPSTNEMLDNNGDYQKYLEETIVKFVNTEVVLRTAMMGPALKTLSFLDRILLLSFGLKGFELYGSSYSYAVTIDSVFMRVNKPKQIQPTPNLHELADFVKDNKEPFPIINGTVWEWNGNQCRSGNATFFNEVFEFTPIRMGSEGFGFNDQVGWVNLMNIAAASGAAIDNYPPLIWPLMKHAGLILGARIPTFLSAPRILPKGEIGQYRINSNLTRVKDIFISDGGFSDNLGAYSVIKRLCKHIIIVDAEHDPSMAFEGYHKLKAKLKEEMGITMKVPGLERIAYDLWGDNCTEYSKWESKDRDMKQLSETQPKRFYRADSMPINVFKGEIGPIPYQDGENLRELVLDVTYIKLSLDSSDLDNPMYGESTKEYL